MNLLVNAAQAFERADPSRNRVLVAAEHAGGWVTVRVSDNGPGIASDVLPRIFDPFFTTKAVGEGTGLGLSISHSTISALGGELRCETEWGKGSSFVVRLPVARACEVQPPSEPQPEAAPRPRVLLVEDDAAVTRVIVRVLEREYEVVAELDARAACQRLERGEEFELILCGMSLAFLSGPELYGRAKAQSAALARRFVFILGGAVRADMQRFLESIPNERLDKPISTQSLRAVLERVLGAAAREAAE